MAPLELARLTLIIAVSIILFAFAEVAAFGVAALIGAALLVTAIGISLYRRSLSGSQIENQFETTISALPIILVGLLLSWGVVQALFISIRPEATYIALFSACSCIAVTYLGAIETQRRGAETYLSKILIAMSIVVGASMFAFILRPFFNGWFDVVAFGQAFRGTFESKNQIASFTGIGIILALQQIKSRTGQSKALSWITLFVLAAGFLLAQSRGASIALVGSLAIWIFLWSRLQVKDQSTKLVRNNRRSTIVVTSLLILGIGLGMAARFLRFGFDGRGREEIYSVTLAALRDHWFLGSGMGTFAEIFPAFQIALLDPAGPITHAHNDYLETLLTFGLFGTMVLVAIWGWILVSCAKELEHSTARKGNGILGLTLTVYLALNCLIDFPAQSPALLVTYFAIMGVVLAPSLVPASRSQTHSPT